MRLRPDKTLSRQLEKRVERSTIRGERDAAVWRRSVSSQPATDEQRKIVDSEDLRQTSCRGGRRDHCIIPAGALGVGNDRGSPVHQRQRGSKLYLRTQATRIMLGHPVRSRCSRSLIKSWSTRYISRRIHLNRSESVDSCKEKLP